MRINISLLAKSALILKLRLLIKVANIHSTSSAAQVIEKSLHNFSFSIVIFFKYNEYIVSKVFSKLPEFMLERATLVLGALSPVILAKAIKRLLLNPGVLESILIPSMLIPVGITE